MENCCPDLLVKKPKVLVMSLSINKKTASDRFVASFSNLLPSNYTDLKGIIYTQGYSFTDEDINCSYLESVRNDLFLFVNNKKKFPISTIRSYFTYKTLKEYDFDYILFCDDDFYFKDGCAEQLDSLVRMMESYSKLGLISLKNRGLSSNKIETNYNPCRVYMRSGMLVRNEALLSINDNPQFQIGLWGHIQKCSYFEECLLAMNIYLAGYDIYSSSISISNPVDSEGLGKTIENLHPEMFRDKNFNGGRQILHRLGFVVPRKDGRGDNYKYVPVLSNRAKEIHEENRRLL